MDVFLKDGHFSPQKTNSMDNSVADDEETNLRLAGSILSKAGFHVSAMRSGQALLKYLTDHKPDLILLDLQMPEMDGFETLEKLRAMNGTADIPVVFLTADDTEEAKRKGMSLGAEDFFRKPFLPELLVRRIRRFAELAELRREKRIR